MKVLLLSAGLGKRLRPVTDKTPKCLVPINGRPLLDFWLKNLSISGLGPFLVNTNYLAEQVEEFIFCSPYRDKVTIVHEEELLGTGGTLLKNRKFFNAEPLMLVHADNLCLCDFREFLTSHDKRPAKTFITMMTFKTSSPEQCGIVELDEVGVVQQFHEKIKNPPGDLANGAVYILEQSVVDFIDSLGRSFVDFSLDVLPEYIGRINTWENREFHMDIGTVDNLRKAEKDYSQLDL